MSLTGHVHNLCQRTDGSKDITKKIGSVQARTLKKEAREPAKNLQKYYISNCDKGLSLSTSGITLPCLVSTLFIFKFIPSKVYTTYTYLD